jgi:hypothetical protein
MAEETGDDAPIIVTGFSLIAAYVYPTDAFAL